LRLDSEKQPPEDTITNARAVEVFPHVADRYFGYSGWCRLNEFGDRAPTPYDIWGYGVNDEGEIASILYGSYTVGGEVVWDSEVYPPTGFP
jgi:hypothetical protein